MKRTFLRRRVFICFLGLALGFLYLYGCGEGSGEGNPDISSPDLIVLAPDVSDSSPETGGTFWLLVTVTNQGEKRSAATTVRYKRSTDATITTSDTSVGTEPVLALGPSQGSGKMISLMAPSTAGTYYYGACVDAVPGEDTTNNCSGSVSVEVSE